MKNKFIILIILAAVLLSAFCSCDLLHRDAGGFLDCALTKYENEDYNFIFKYPSLYKTIKVTDSTENKDESVIEFKASDTNIITLYCNYNPEDNLYEFIKAKGFLPEKTYTVNQNVFIYDRRDGNVGDTPAYYIIGATRRMVYIVEYKFDKGDEIAYKMCERLSFDFSYYANTPKENASLSEPIVLANGFLSVKLPGNAKFDFYPKYDIPETTEPVTQEGDETAEEVPKSYLLYNKVTATGRDIFASFYANVTAPSYTNEEIKGGALDYMYDTMIENTAGILITDVVCEEPSQNRNTVDTEYSIFMFACKYNGKEAHGSVMAGYGRRGQYFEFVYVVTDDASEGEFDNYNDMLESIKM